MPPFARVEECICDSEFVVCGKFQQAFTVVVQLMHVHMHRVPHHPPSLSFYLLAGTRVCVHQHKIHSFLGILCTKLSSLCQKARFFSLCLGSVDAYPTTKLTAWYCPNISKRIDIRRSLTPSLVNLDVLHIDILTANATLYRTAVEHAVPCCCCRDCPPWSSRFLNPQHRYVFCCCRAARPHPTHSRWLPLQTSS